MSFYNYAMSEGPYDYSGINVATDEVILEVGNWADGTYEDEGGYKNPTSILPLKALAAGTTTLEIYTDDGYTYFAFDVTVTEAAA